jgi:hypothetical protein
MRDYNVLVMFIVNNSLHMLIWHFSPQDGTMQG